MDQQVCAPDGITLTPMPKDPQADMIVRCHKFQELVGTWDHRIKGFGDKTWVRHDRAVHHIDMAVQECSEMWDMLEGGWKHHKKNPSKPDRDEVMLEAIDVLTFAYNAYLFMGGEPEAEVISKLVGRSPSIPIVPPEMDLDWSWSKWDPWFTGGGKRGLIALYGHGDGAHGETWVKECAAYTNAIRARIGAVAETIRGALMSMSREQRTPNVFPASPGYFYIEAVCSAVALVRAIPGSTQEELYAAFVKKNDINVQRQKDSY